MVKSSKYITKTVVPAYPIEKLIHVIRGEKVMLDRDIAVLYGVKSIALRQQVKRNQERFPADFMFQLTKAEAELLVSQSVIPSRRSLGGFLPLVFTQEGVAMLSSVLRSSQAVQMNISIMRAFVSLREIMASHKEIAQRVEKLEKHSDRTSSIIEMLVEDIDRLSGDIQKIKAPSPYKKRRIGYIVDED